MAAPRPAEYEWHIRAVHKDDPAAGTSPDPWLTTIHIDAASETDPVLNANGVHAGLRNRNAPF